MDGDAKLRCIGSGGCWSVRPGGANEDADRESLHRELDGFFSRGAAMGCLILSGTLLQMALLVPSVVHGMEGSVKPTDAAAAVLYQRKFECHYANGMAGAVRFLGHTFWDRQECLHFDSRLGRFQAISPLCEGTAERFNRNPQMVEYWGAQVGAFCRHNYQAAEAGDVVGRQVQPTVKISHTKGDPLAHPSLLICTAAGYYPSEIKIKWLKNGQEQTEGVGYSEKFQNGDWTFQDQVMLETVPQQGDVYICQVEHSSVKEPIAVQWEPRLLNSAQSKVWTGALGAVLGVAFGAAGVSYLKTRPAPPTAPAAGLIS
ncbi:UNVERIFIED_CONTAM: hypothetical protein K2H54_066494 [Gekko kuhli]